MDLTNQKAKSAALGAAALLAGSNQEALSTDALTLPKPSIGQVEIEKRSDSPEYLRGGAATFPEHWPRPEPATEVPGPVGPRTVGSPPPTPDDNLARKTIVSALSGLFALGGYAVSIHRGTPKEKRQSSMLTRVCESLFPETPFFPNNKASWLMSTLNSSSLFLLGMLSSLQSGQSMASSLLSMAVVGIYAAGAGWLCVNGFKYGGEFKMSPTDKGCLVGGSIGLGTFLYCGLARLGVVPAVDAPLELIGIGAGLLTRSLALFPLVREFVTCVRNARLRASTGLEAEGRKDLSLPSLSAHIFWNAAIMLNLANLTTFFSKAAIVPLGMTMQNWICIGAAIWAHWQVRKLSRSDELRSI